MRLANYIEDFEFFDKIKRFIKTGKSFANKLRQQNLQGIFAALFFQKQKNSSYYRYGTNRNQVQK